MRNKSVGTAVVALAATAVLVAVFGLRGETRRDALDDSPTPSDDSFRQTAGETSSATPDRGAPRRAQTRDGGPRLAALSASAVADTPPPEPAAAATPEEHLAADRAHAVRVRRVFDERLESEASTRDGRVFEAQLIGDTEQAISTLEQLLPVGQGPVLGQIRCGASLCRIRLSADPAVRDELIQMLARTQSFQGEVHATYNEVDEAPRDATIYVSTPEHELGTGDID